MDNNLLEEKFLGLNNLLDEKFKSVHEKLDRVEEQTTRTNGRVSSLENWRSYLTGGLAIVGILVGYLIQQS